MKQRFAERSHPQGDTVYCYIFVAKMYRNFAREENCTKISVAYILVFVFIKKHTAVVKVENLAVARTDLLLYTYCLAKIN